MTGGDGDAALPDVVGAYEALRVDLHIASTAYTHTLAGLAAAEAQAQRQTRYLRHTSSRRWRRNCSIPAAVRS